MSIVKLLSSDNMVTVEFVAYYQCGGYDSLSLGDNWRDDFQGEAFIMCFIQYYLSIYICSIVIYVLSWIGNFKLTLSDQSHDGFIAIYLI